MTKILITGGAGFIGSSLADKLIQNPDNYVVLVDNLLTGDLRKLPDATYKNWRFIKCDVNNYNDIAPVMTSFSFDYVFHYAAVVGVKRTLENPVMVLKDIDGFKNILDLCKNTGVKRIFFSSSSEVYGEPVELPQNEHTTPLNSRLPYAVVKNVGESFCRSYQAEYGLDFTILRFFNTYGEKQSTDFVMSKFIKAALNHQDITVYGDGLQTRTFCYIEDNIEATLYALENELFINDVVNIGNDQLTTILDLAKAIIKLTNSRSQIIHLPPLPEGDMTRRQPDIQKMKQLLHRELLPLEEGIRKILNSRLYFL
ncbi:NAD-dependent epimerase/dehydratase family protein [Thermoflexibacter ruber]|uniref:UDP-glucose 4-epimerase n=1 Tax=Thermoflexibacter ruber TaxID=1003 RepID=A0A1I2HBV6_9BACT|nr:NAD-dependent epimerase/dehydratase family protein [Thermoflexibacter ruber]SFF26061.1 UDP-glucose 4-epimerase [Thermoflexibacter ruber]